jgi:methanogenic corrinoid protein MtbC1
MSAMNDLARLRPAPLSIAAVERDTGLSKDTLRVWERRYGFPAPARDEMDERVYAIDQVEKLRLIKRLLDAGHRPGRIVPLSYGELLVLAGGADEPGAASATAPVPAGAEVRAYLDLIRSHDVAALRGALARALSRLGVGAFVNTVAGPLNTAVGDAWLRGQLEIFEEHLYTEALQVVLRQAIGSLPEPAACSQPRVLLTTFPGEPHGLGLLMAEAMFSLEGCACLSLGTQTPLWDTALAAGAHRSHIVALSFTGCMNPNLIVDGLAELRGKLPADVQVWAGGSAPVLWRRPVEGVQPMGSLTALPEAVRRWRDAASARP